MKRLEPSWVSDSELPEKARMRFGKMTASLVMTTSFAESEMSLRAVEK